MPYCSGCGSELAVGAPACPSCGRPQVVMAVRQTEGQAIASLVLGIVGISGCPVVASIIAIILGSQAKAKIAADPTLQGEGLARAGMILGYVGLGLVGAMLLLWILIAAFTFPIY